MRSIRTVYRRLLQQVERPPALDFQAVFDGPTLLQLATPAAGKAGGPDSWLPDQLARLPLAFWNGVASLWGLVFRAGRIPSRWLESRVCLIPKPSGDLRPLTATSVLWRLGTRSLVQQLRQWLLTWLDHHTLGGVFGSGVLDAHLMLHADSENATYIAQDLHRFFDTVDWQLMEVNLCWLRAPPQLVRLLRNFYTQGSRVFAHAGMLSAHFQQVSTLGFLEAPFWEADLGSSILELAASF